MVASLIPTQIKEFIPYVLSLEVILISVLRWLYKASEGVDLLIKYGVATSTLIIACFTIMKLVDGRKTAKLTNEKLKLEIDQIENELKKK